MRRVISVEALEFDEGGRTLWVQGPYGTVLRVPHGTTFSTEQCRTSRSSHADLTIEALADVVPGRVCLGEDVL